RTAGSVKMQVPGVPSFDQTTSGSLNTWQQLTSTYTPTSSVFDCVLQFVSASGSASYYVDSVSVIETNLNGTPSIVQKRGVIGAANPLLQNRYIFQVNGKDLSYEI